MRKTRRCAVENAVIKKASGIASHSTVAPDVVHHAPNSSSHYRWYPTRIPYVTGMPGEL